MASIPFQGRGGTISTSSLLDYLRPDIARPDIYERESYIVKDIHGSNLSSETRKRADNTFIYTVGIILLSALIFITFVAWADVLRSWYDSMFVNSIISTETISSLYYAITITIISIVITIILLLFWIYIIK